MEARSATLRDVDDVLRSRGGLGRHRHGLGRHRHQAEAEGKRGCSKNLHRYFLSCLFRRDAAESGLRKQHGSPVTPNGVTDTVSPPVAMVPMMMVPMVMPVVVMPVVSPTYLLRLETIDLVLCHDCGLYGLASLGRQFRLR
ncbi:MAG TPA: hypothetical protein VHY35_11955, partial [Stellaceae bacterium]|nr:hypothetical protein [Stellaceae bacterium]